MKEKIATIVKYKEISWRVRRKGNKLVMNFKIFCVINVKYKEISWRVRRRRKKVTSRSTE